MTEKAVNVVIVITDDQGYGDLGCTGNPWLRTPHIDNFNKGGCSVSRFPRVTSVYAVTRCNYDRAIPRTQWCLGHRLGSFDSQTR